jgi:hypothetical protein
VGGSAGSVLRSLRKLGGGWGFRAVREGFLVFASKARCGPLPLRWACLGALRGNGPALAEEAWGRMELSRCARGALVIASKARFGPIPLRLACWGLRGNGPARAEKALGSRGFRAVREGLWCSLPRLATDRSRSAGRMGRSAGTVLRSLRKLWGGGAFALCARDFVVRFQGSLRTDPAPLGVFWRSAGSVLRALRKARGRMGLSRFARGALVFASKARFGPIPLRWACWGLRGIGPALAEEARGRMELSRCARWVFGDRLQGLLRTDPAPLGVWGAPRERSYAR